LQHLCAEVGVICSFGEKKVPTTVMLELQNELFVLVGTLFLGQIGFLSQTATPQPSQQGKEGQDEGICPDSSMMLSNCVHHWMGRVEVSSLLDGERATIAILVWPQTLPCFFWDVSIF
jgi:hypothetical protein